MPFKAVHHNKFKVSANECKGDEGKNNFTHRMGMISSSLTAGAQENVSLQGSTGAQPVGLLYPSSSDQGAILTSATACMEYAHSPCRVIQFTPTSMLSLV